MSISEILVARLYHLSAVAHQRVAHEADSNVVFALETAAGYWHNLGYHIECGGRPSDDKVAKALDDADYWASGEEAKHKGIPANKDELMALYKEIEC